MQSRVLVSVATLFAVVATACAPAAAPSPTAAPAATNPPAAATTAPAAVPAATKPAAAGATAAPAAAAAAPSPAVKPTAAATPAAGVAATASKKPRGDIRIAFVVGSLDNPYWITMRDAATAEAAKEGIQLTYLGIPKEADIDRQIAIVEDMITQKVDVLVLAPAGSKELIPAIQQANAANIPVICVDRGAEGGKLLTVIATDNVQGAKLGAEYLAKALGGKGNVAILEGIQAIAPGRDRRQGANEGFAESPGIKVVASQPAEWRQDLGESATENILTANPDLNGLFASNDQMGLGAVQAIAAAGKSDQVKVVGYDAIDPALQDVKDGKMIATVKQFPEKMGELGVQYAVRAADGDTSFPEFIDSGVTVVDNTNVDQYLKK